MDLPATNLRTLAPDFRNVVFLFLAVAIYQSILAVSEGLFQYECLLIAVNVIVLVFAAGLLPSRRSLSDRTFGLSLLAIILAAAQMIVLGWSKSTYYYVEPSGITIPFAGLCIVLGLGACAVFIQKYSKRLLIAAGVVQLLVAVFVVRHSINPKIDVYMFHQESAQAMLDGINPYTITFANPYLEPDGSPSRFYSLEVQKNGRVMFGFPYPPMSMWMYLPSYWLTGESRYAHALAFVLAGVGIACVSRSRLATAAALLLMTAPAQWVVIENAWTEPFILVSLVGVALAAVRAPKLLPVALGLFFAMKQYNIIFVPLVWLILPRPLAWKTSFKFMSVIILTGAAVSLPLAMWDWAAFWNSNVTIQMNQPFRFDAFSFLAMFANSVPAHILADGTKVEFDPPKWWSMIAFALLIPTWIVLLWRMPRNIAGFVMGIGLTSIVFLFSNRQAFLNYHTFAAGAFLLAVACMEAMRDVDRMLSKPNHAA